MRSWKIGAITSGILLIAIGILWLLQSFLSFSITTVLLYTWPIICILLGIEILVLHFFQKEQSLKVHWLSIFLLLLIGGASLVFSFGKAALDEVGFSFQTASYQLTKSLSPSVPIKEVIVTVPDYNVSITGGDENTVSVDGLLTANVKNDNLLEQQINKSFSMKQINNKVYVDMHEKFEFSNTTGTLHIMVPKNIALTVTVNQGAIEIDQIHGSAILQTNHGNITAKQLHGSLTVQSYGGNIQIEDSNLNSHSLIETSSGNIILNLKQDSSAALDAVSQSGEIMGNVQWNTTSSANSNDDEAEEQQRATAQVGNGKNPIILSTDSGNIIVNH